VAGCCECGDEFSGFLKYGDFFFWQAEDLLFSQEGCSSVELVS
jgi:hypothetical protein